MSSTCLEDIMPCKNSAVKISDVPLSDPDSMTGTIQNRHPKSRADITKFLQGAQPSLVSEMLGNLPPSFFIVGAPRCGTTALSKAIAGHPHIAFSKPKETHFHLEDRSAMPIEDIRRLYLERFQPCLARDSQAIGDGSVSYLYEPDAIRRAIAFDHRAKFIAAVRNPLDMLHSYHARLLYTLDEDEADFSRAWCLQNERGAGHKIPKRCRAPQLLQYGEIAMLGRHIERLFEVAGRERCHVVVFDDLVSNPGDVYKQVLEFIGVDDDHRRVFKAMRSNTGVKNRWLQQFAMNPPEWIFRLIDLSDTGTLKRLKKLRKRIKRFNKARERRSPLPGHMRDMLNEYYRLDVEKLSALLGRDVTYWLRQQPSVGNDKRA
jgi:hypothetical protein